MANSRFEYVKKFELDDQILPGCWIVIRLDGKGFTKYVLYGLKKLNVFFLTTCKYPDSRCYVTGSPSSMDLKSLTMKGAYN